MKKIETFKNKKVLVLGLAKSGEAAAKLLDKLGAIVTVNDSKPFDENPSAQALLEEGIKVICGSHPLELLDENFEWMVKNPGIRYDNPMVVKALEKGIPVI
nr:UDP-N-acetylmuramoyl-L-alanine--D-glutamate ligase [Leuconostoc sp.]